MSGDITRKRLRTVWHGMKARCLDQNGRRYHRYGGRGIRVCLEWVSSFQSFHDWALANGYQYGLQIDRRDNNGDYEPGNCRFVTTKENAANRSGCGANAVGAAVCLRCKQSMRIKSRGNCAGCLADVWTDIHAGVYTEQDAVARGILAPAKSPGRPRKKRRRKFIEKNTVGAK